jgi:membrane fusion protein, multidrug efflux system
VRQYEGTVKTDQAMVNNAQLNLAYCHIVAPVAGRVGLRQVDTGNYVQTSDANGIVVITQLKPISVIFTLPEDSLPAVLKRMHSGATLQVTIYDRTQTNRLATGTLATIDNQIDTSTGTVKLRAQFDNDDESLFPNQFVNAELLVDTLHGATIVPAAAIQRGAPGTYVYLLAADQTVSVKPVKLGPADGERVAVTEGLSPGDKVVTDGADRLRDGAKVTVPDPGAPATKVPPGAAAGKRKQNRQGGSQPAPAQ